MAATRISNTNHDTDMNAVPIGIDEIVVTVVGAGRGPLVACALNASCTTGVRIRVYAVEKNMNAVVTLRNRVLTGRFFF